MNALGRLCGVLGIVSAAALTGCHERVMTVHELIDWHKEVGVHASWPRYQGSDKRYHHFSVYAFTDWYVFKIARSELALKEEHPYSEDAPASFEYYEVDDFEGFGKIEKTTRPNQTTETTRGK